MEYRNIPGQMELSDFIELPDTREINRSIDKYREMRKINRSVWDYALPCGGCLCNHCANNLYSEDKAAGEAKIFCDACEECRWYDGNPSQNDMWRQQCGEFIITQEGARRRRKKIRMVKK